jgi:hypothetical protein
MRPIPLNLMTLYADLAQQVDWEGSPSASISTKTVDGKKYLYSVTKDGQQRIQRYLGPASDPASTAAAVKIKHLAEQARQRRATVTLLKNGRFPAPSLVLGRILEVLANAGLFRRGMTLVGTAAYQTYAGIVGSYLPATALMTNDVDLSVAQFVAAADEEDIETILKRADSSFEPHWSATDKLPKVFRASNGFSVDVITQFGRGRRSPVQIEALGCAAEALSFQEYPAEETILAVALYGSGVLVRVPTPLRYAIHKLIVAQHRDKLSPKRAKDLLQAREMIDIYLEIDDAALLDELDAARARGPTWRSAINASLAEIGRDVRQGRLPAAPEPVRNRLPRRG